MALIRCAECGKELSDKAEVCIHCGCPIQSGQQNVGIDVRAILKKNNLSKFAASVEISKIADISRAEAVKMIEDEIGDESYSFMDKLKAQTQNINESAALQREEKKKEKEEEKARIAKMDREGTAYCPKCKSTSLSAHKKGFGIGKAVVGAAFTGGIGLVAGNLGAKKVRVTCMNCGHQFFAGRQ
ncbi:MAG: zinc ribbon domain-containing protein [Bacillota bacterium]